MRRAPLVWLLCLGFIGTSLVGEDFGSSNATAQISPGDDGKAVAKRRRRGRRKKKKKKIKRIDAGYVTRSIGAPFAGSLHNGMPVRASDELVVLPGESNRHSFFGTVPMVKMLVEASEKVWKAKPGARLRVGELSRRTGGLLQGHRSHQSGRDVDLGLYLTTKNGTPLEARFYIAVDAAGRGRLGKRPVRFDDVRNYHLVKALVMNEHAIVQFIFASKGIKRRLMKTARKLGASKEVLKRITHVVIPPPNSAHPHDNHFHVRIYCSMDDIPQCLDKRPFWPWIPREHPYFYKANPLPD